MSKLYVCKEYENMFTEGFKIVESIEEHDKRVIQNYIDEVVSKFEEIYKDYVRYNPPMDDYQNGFEVGVEVMAERAIEIVKDGGVDD